jgi:hypothetical protein
MYTDPHLFLRIKNKQLQASSNIAVTEYSVFYLWGGGGGGGGRYLVLQKNVFLFLFLYLLYMSM